MESLVLLANDTGNVNTVGKGRVNIEEYRASEPLRDFPNTFSFAESVQVRLDNVNLSKGHPNRNEHKYCGFQHVAPVMLLIVEIKVKLGSIIVDNVWSAAGLQEV